MVKKIETSIIISTYNQPNWLQKVLWSLQYQTVTNFEVIIADDGSTEDTKSLITKFSKSVDFTIKHVWQADEGFQKTKILNKALLQCTANYVIFTDGDCILRADFIATHLNYKEQGYFLSGGYFKLPMSISKAITKQDIEAQNCFNIKWLKVRGLGYSFKNNKLTAKGNLAKFLNFITPTKATWDGNNASGFKADLLAVNGFDERMQYGGEDRELGERLFNYGIKAKQIRYSAICVHLDHARSYVKPEMISKNKAIRKYTKTKKVVKTPFGIKKLNS